MTRKKWWRGFVLLLAFSGLPKFCGAQFIDQEATSAGAAAAVITLSTQFHHTALDCSHFVNYLFEQVGLYYKYQPSRVLYGGSAPFRRVHRPMAGDLIVWPGHVGIIVDPVEKTFISALRRGVRISSYTSAYWRRRGHARFFRYRLPISTDSLFAWQTSISDDSGAGLQRAGMQ